MEETPAADIAPAELQKELRIFLESTVVSEALLQPFADPKEMPRKETLKKDFLQQEAAEREMAEQCHSQLDATSTCIDSYTKGKKKKRGIKRKKTNVTCEVCSRQFRDNHNLRRHFETKHGKCYTCDLCFAMYNTERKLQRHMKKHMSPRGRVGKGETCSECSRVFRDKHNLRIHRCSKSNKKSVCIYPECDLQFYHVTKMLKHVEEDHDSRIDTVNMTFESEALFQRWKEEEELKSFAYFSKRSGTVDSDYGSYRCYVCQANGDNIDGPRKTLKRWKKGQVRIGKLCPSRMLVKEISGKIMVKYISFHSHSRSIKNDKLPVPKSVKTYAKNLLLMGASPQQVRKSVCEGLYGGSSIIPQGGYIISNRYFFDLKKRLDTQPISNSDEEREKYDPVFVYKPQGQTVVVGDEELDKLPHSNDLFAIGLQTKEQCIMMKKRSHKIVCVTSAQTYNLFGYEIVTLVVPDVFGNGYPVAYFLTSHVDEITLKLLLQCLRIKCPNVKIRSVMTDDNISVFNAINSVFGNVRHYLCHWYVEKCWENEIQKNGKTLDVDLSMSLKAMLYEKSKNVFKVMCNDFVEKYSHNSDFVKYFASNFLTHPDVWAMCYRHSSHDVSNPLPYTNISLQCEYVQSRLKAFITNSGTSTSQRIADVALLILNIQEGHYLQYKKHLQIGTRVRSAAKGKHYNGLTIKDSNVSRSSGTWYVNSQYDNVEVFTVRETAGRCSQCVCYEQCYEAPCEGLCSHIYKCACDDRVGLCEHIHKVHSLRLKQERSVCITSSSKSKPRNIEFVVSDNSEAVDNNSVNCITVIKQERETFTDTDVDFVSINIDEVSEHAEVLERLHLAHEETSNKGDVVKQENSAGKQRCRKWKRCVRKSISSHKQLQGIRVDSILQRQKNDRLRRGSCPAKDCDIETASKLPQPAIKLERVDDSESDVPLIKIRRLPGDVEDQEGLVNICKVECKPEVSTEETNRSKRLRFGSVVQAAIENKKRRLEMPVKNRQMKTEDTSDDLLISVTTKSKNLKCKHCDGIFRDAYNLKRHIQNKHSNFFPFVCPLCSTVFKTKLRYEKHVKNHNGAKSAKSVQCTECLRTFRDQYNMKKHHCDKARKQSKCIYPECEMQFYHMTQMVKHLEDDHNDKINCNDLHFESEKLFLAWKEEEEAASLAVFNKRNGTLGSDNIKYSYYICQAGGESLGASKTSRRWKNKVRTGKVCPSRMLVKEKDGKIAVKYIFYHSHDVKNDYKRYPPLPKYVKELGKQLLLMGVSPKRVRESIQDGVLLNDSKVAQKQYTVKNRFFYDMKKRLEKKGYVFPSEMEKSETADRSDSWKPKDFVELVSNGKHKNDNPLLIYKPQGQPVINIDEELSLHPFSNKLFALGFQTKDQNEMMKEGCCKLLCIKSYFDFSTDGFQLLNLSVPDKYGNGYPVAHFITNCVDEETLTFLFKSLKKRCPNLEVRALITDDKSCIYKAVQRVFGDVHHYICHWFVKTCWLEKIEELVESADHKVDIPYRLMDILYERDESKFQMLCRNFGNVYSSVCKDFMKFFVDVHLENPESWAMCYRQNLDGITYSEPFSNVNLHCEYLHNHLKLSSLKGKFSQRVAELTKLLLRVEREYNVMYKRNTHLNVPLHSSASGRHYSGLEIEDDQVQNIGDTWSISSRYDKTIKYTVSVVENNCNRVNCYEKCFEFLCLGLCNHLYVCSCDDRADLCEHIHKIHSLRLRQDRPSDIETLTAEKASSSIQLIVHECLEKELLYDNRLKIELEPFPTLDPLDDKVVCHEIYELDM